MFICLAWHGQGHRDSAAAERLSRSLLYDVPKPAKPVQQPYLPPPEEASQDFPPPPPVTPTEGEARHEFGESDC